MSFGITLNINSYKNIDDAIKNADMMLYRAKEEGRNRVIYEKQKVFKVPTKQEYSK